MQRRTDLHERKQCLQLLLFMVNVDRIYIQNLESGSDMTDL